MARPQQSIRRQLAILVLAVALPLTGLEIYSFVTNHRQWNLRARESVLSYAEATALTVDQFLSETRQVLGRLAERPTIRAMEPGACDAWIKEAHAILPEAMNLLVADSAGTLICSAVEGLQPFLPSVAHQQWFQGVKATRDFTIGPPLQGVFNDTWLATLASPIFDDDGRMIGAVGMVIDLLRFETFITALTLPSGGVVTLAEDDGTVVARSEDGERWVGQQLPMSGDSVRQATLERGISETTGLEGVERVWGWVQVPNSAWRVYAGLPLDYIRLEPRRAAFRSGFFGIVLLGLVTLLSITTYRRTSRALQSLVADTRAAASGGTATVATDGPAEVVEVAEQVNRTLAARTRAEDELRQANIRLSSIMENAVFGIYVVDMDGNFLAVNTALVSMLGYDSADEMMQVNVDQLYREPAEREELRAQRLRHGRTDGHEVTWLRKDGTPITVRICGKGFQDETGRGLVEWIAEDVTQRRELEDQFRQAQKMEAIGQLTGGVAHDFNNLLTVIMGNIELLESGLDPSGPDLACVENAMEAAQRAARLTQRLLAFSRKQALRPQAVDLHQLVSGMDELLRRTLGETISVEIVRGVDLWKCEVDPSQLENALLNLAINARDAMPNGGKLTIETTDAQLDGEYATTEEDVARGDYVMLAVSDVGHGMPAEVLSQVFDPFFTTKDVGRGSGMGLSMVYGFVKQSGGQVKISSEVGQGTTVRIYLPRAAAGQAEVVTQEPQGVDLKGSGELIMVVEDDASVRRLTLDLLERLNYRTVEAADAATALEMLEHARDVSLLFTDVVLPGGTSGADLARETRRRWPELRVLFTSGYMQEAFLRHGRLDPGFELLEKPFTKSDLARKIREVLSADAA